MSQYDEVEYGDTGLSSKADGSYYNKYTQERYTPDGKVFDKDNELIYDPEEDEKEIE